MKTQHTPKLICITALSLLLNSFALAYPPDPDNAALLYYQAFLLCGKPDDSMESMLRNVLDGKADPNEKIIEYIKKYKQPIRLVTAASKISYCNWGLKYSDGISMQMPCLVHTRILTFVMCCDAKILASKGDFTTALERCLTLQRMARHFGSSTDVGYLMEISIIKRSATCIQEILSQMPTDPELVNGLWDELNLIDHVPFSMIQSFQEGLTVFRTYMNQEKVQELIDANCAKEDLLQQNKEFFDENIVYWDHHVADVMSAFALPYPLAYPKLKSIRLSEPEDIKGDPQVKLAISLFPAFDVIYSNCIKGQTQFNALKAAVEIYKIKSESGKLPEVLPPDLPKDLFSDKPFIYEKTADGFILRCQGKDLYKNTIDEYKFIVN